MVNPVKPTLGVLGRRIRERRQVKGWSQEELADRAKLDRSYIGGIERGERNITVLKLCQVAAALKLDLGSLMRGLPSAAAR